VCRARACVPAPPTVVDSSELVEVSVKEVYITPSSLMFGMENPLGFNWNT
jgi:hypothetical protein